MNGSGQTLLTLLAITVLGLLTLNANQLILYSFQHQLSTKQTVAAMVAANSLLEQIQSKPFDQVVVSSSLGSKVDQNKSKLVADLTLPLGPEAGERYPFNDLDDYNGYRCKVWNPLGSDSLSLITTVYYVNASNPSQWSGVRTEAKKVIVKVFAPGMTDTLAFQQVVFQ